MSENLKAVPESSSTTRLSAVRRGLCPRCKSGRIFRGSFSMNEPCPVCGLDFGREPGYFTVAMFVSYALGVPILGIIILALRYGLFLDWQLHWVLALATVLFLPLVPAIFRYSRIIWIHLDRYLDP